MLHPEMFQQITSVKRTWSHTSSSDFCVAEFAFCKVWLVFIYKKEFPHRRSFGETSGLSHVVSAQDVTHMEKSTRGSVAPAPGEEGLLRVGFSCLEYRWLASAAFKST